MRSWPRSWIHLAGFFETPGVEAVAMEGLEVCYHRNVLNCGAYAFDALKLLLGSQEGHWPWKQSCFSNLQ